ncbi:unnamed protein product [Orchesella dallaii]|uniref:Uncharacterized protein n=1 Tax=Orchesella dallaii TaxID=48710 RepID=A0ABP1Q8Y9_9HEXA
MEYSGYWDSSFLSNHNRSLSFIDSFIQSPRAVLPHTSPPPPSGELQRNTITINTPFRLQPIATIASNAYPAKLLLGSTNFSNPSNASIVLCQLIPATPVSWTDIRLRRIKRKRNEQIRSKRRIATRKSHILANLKNKVLKRLQRRPNLKTKKQEIYEKWKCKKLRREFRSSQRSQSQRSVRDILNTSTLDACIERERSASPFQCPLWCCGRKRRRRCDFIDDYDHDKYVGVPRPSARSRSRASKASKLSRRRSRSPIILRNY